MTTSEMRLRDLSPRWLTLLLIIRLATGATGCLLLAAHHVTSYDGTLATVAIAYVAATAVIVRRWPIIAARPAAWLLDVLVVLVLVVLTGDWRSPFYLLALTTLAAPAAVLCPSHALYAGSTFALVYAAIGQVIGPPPLQLGAQSTVETLATHLALPVLVAYGISYAADAVRELRMGRRRVERLAIDAERQRIAWELHDPAKQRVHAAHLVLDSLSVPDDSRLGNGIRQVLSELEAAVADMDTSVAELRSPLEGRPVAEALAERVAALKHEGGPSVIVAGELPPLEPLQAAHAYRIAAEALTNAVRHGRASEVIVTLGISDGEGHVRVVDDGVGLPPKVRPGSHGLRAMRNRALTIGGRLVIASAPGGAGTEVDLRFPLVSEVEEKQRSASSWSTTIPRSAPGSKPFSSRSPTSSPWARPRQPGTSGPC